MCRVLKNSARTTNKRLNKEPLIAAALSPTTKKQLPDAYIQSLHTNKEGHASKQVLLTYDSGPEHLAEQQKDHHKELARERMLGR